MRSSDVALEVAQPPTVGSDSQVNQEPVKKRLKAT